MLHNIKDLYGCKLAALDGDIGHVKDFYFDDKTWVIRYLVADTGAWLSGRQVLLSPHAFGKCDPQEKIFHLNLKKKQIEDSPPIDAHRPVSRQYEAEYFRYYGWPAYWNGDLMWGLGGYPILAQPTTEELASLPRHHHREDKHLQSSHAVDGYHIQTSDGPIGHLRGFLVDERSWAIRELIVEAGHWYAGKQILIPTSKVERVSYEESMVFVSLTKADIERTPADHIAKAGA